VNAQVTQPRLVALDVLRRTHQGELADRALDNEAQVLSARDRAWTQELVYGTLRLRGRIDYMLGILVRGGTDSLEPAVLDVLRLGVYQLLEMGSVPAYAAISQSQELARAAGAGRASALVAGVLHALERRKGTLRFPSFDADPVEHLATWGSHPRWLVERWVTRWGPEETRRLVEANNQRPELYIHPLGAAADEAAARLREAGIGTEAVAVSPHSLRILPPHGASEALATVAAVVQDPAATLVTWYAAPPAGATVLDLCAAPGGKAMGLAARTAYVAAADLSWGRLRRLRENAARLDQTVALGMVAADARQPPFRPSQMVLLDVPCTGTGTLRRHPDGRWRLRPEHLEELGILQRDLLESAASVVRPGGWLVYSTCALEPEENEVQVRDFLTRHPEFEADAAAGAVAPELISEQGWLAVLPQKQGVDGSFAARMRRRG
jgi:16S rRNA (cytosine967-C5)-methyltransferase